MFSKMSIQTKLLSALVLIILINVIAGGFIIYSVSVAGTASHEVEKLFVVQQHVNKIKDASLNAHKSMISFLNSGDLSKKEAHEKILASLFPLMDKSQSLTDDQKILAALSDLKKELRQWEDDIASKQADFMHSPQTVDMARLLESSEENEAIWKKVYADFDALFEELGVLTQVKSAELDRIMMLTTRASVVGLILTLVASLGACVFVVFLVSRPLQNLVLSTNALVQKDWGADISGVDREDEIGQMAKALLLFRDNGVENEKLTMAQKEDDQKRLQRARSIEEMVENFRKESSEVTHALEGATHKMSDSSVKMNEIANNTNQLSEEVSRSAQSAGQNVNSVSAATEQLTASIREISNQLSNTNTMAQNAKSVSLETVNNIKSLEVSASEIGGVIEIISEIAEQTNLLALNATIEAARAGDAGKGFAVVASEVKSLANETAQATEKVRTQIAKIQGETGEAVTFIERISKSVEELTESMTAIAAAMEEQTSATQEISRNVSEASQGTDSVVQSIGSVSSATQETQETSQMVGQIADELKQRSNTLKESIDAFISSIQAA